MYFLVFTLLGGGKIKIERVTGMVKMLNMPEQKKSILNIYGIKNRGMQEK